ncbi:hypothetical protein BZZ08_07106 [Streptomyces sp. MH60]|nr:hypothetical protein BZZ08_07106 [Streptomyces sp. MH60]
MDRDTSEDAGDAAPGRWCVVTCTEGGPGRRLGTASYERVTVRGGSRPDETRSRPHPAPRTVVLMKRARLFSMTTPGTVPAR